MGREHQHIFAPGCNKIEGSLRLGKSYLAYSKQTELLGTGLSVAHPLCDR